MPLNIFAFKSIFSILNPDESSRKAGMGHSDFSDPKKAKTPTSDKGHLATDYLNHFNGIVMMIELLPDTPELLHDILAWQPVSYVEHFQHSQFSARDSVLAQYAGLPDSQRIQLNRLSLDATRLVVTMQALLRDGGHGVELSALCAVAAETLRALISRLAAFIAGERPPDEAHPDDKQQWIDALFDASSRKPS